MAVIRGYLRLLRGADIQTRVLRYVTHLLASRNKTNGDV